MTTTSPHTALLTRGRLVLSTLVLLTSAAMAYTDQDPTLLVLAVAAVLLAWLFVDSDRAFSISDWLRASAPRAAHSAAGTIPAPSPWRTRSPHATRTPDGAPAEPVPRLFINLAVLAWAVWLGWQVLQTDSGRNLVLTVGRFIAGLVLCKLFEPKSPRNYLQIVVLTLLVMVTAAMFCTTLGFGAILCAYLAVAVYALLLLMLRQDSGRAAAAGTAPALPHNGLVRIFRRHLRRAALLIAAILLPVCLLVFLILPRNRGTGVLIGWSPGATYQTGLTDVVPFPRFGQLVPSDTLVMEVKLTQNGMNVGSELYQPYFRGWTLDAYSRNPRTGLYEWSQNASAPESPHAEDELSLLGGDVLDHGVAVIPDFDGGVPTSRVVQSYTVDRIPDGNTLFAIAPPWLVSARAGDFTSVKFRRADFGLTAPGIHGATVNYSVTSPESYNGLQFHDQPTVPPGFLPTRRRVAPYYGAALAPAPRFIPVPNEVVRIALNVLQAKQLQPPAGEAIAPESIRPAVSCFVTYLRTYPYSLSFEQKDLSLDPTADFLINRKETGGPCYYFASALVMMCRAVGINARMVTGYHGGDFNSIINRYEVRQKHAHAWAEVYYPNSGWTTVDPSPFNSDDDMQVSALTRWCQEVSELSQSLWLATVVSFDNESRAILLARLSRTYGNLKYLLAETFYYGAVAPGSALGYFTFVGPWLGLGLVAGWVVRRWRRDRAAGKPLVTLSRTNARLPAEVAFLQDLFRLLARAHPPRRLAQTPREYAAQLRADLGPAAADHVDWLIDAFYGIRFGALTPSAELRARIALTLRQLRDALRGI